MAKSSRKILNYGRKNIGKFPSFKNGTSVWFESYLEADYLYHLEYDRDVLRYETQWVRLRYWADERVRTYTPDVRLWRSGAREIIEVKPEKVAETPKWDRLFRTVGPIFRQYGYEFLLRNEHHIRSQPRLENLKFLYPYAGTLVPPDAQVTALDFLAGNPEARLGGLDAHLAKRGYERAVLYAMMFHQVAVADLDAEAGPAMPVKFGSLREDLGEVTPWV